MQHTVVALRGDEARKAYFDNKRLNFIEGYKVLLGGVRPSLESYQRICQLNISHQAPSVEDINLKRGEEGKFSQRIALLLNRNRLTDGECLYRSISLVCKRLIIISSPFLVLWYQQAHAGLGEGG